MLKLFTINEPHPQKTGNRKTAVARGQHFVFQSWIPICFGALLYERGFVITKYFLELNLERDRNNSNFLWYFTFS